MNRRKTSDADRIALFKLIVKSSDDEDKFVKIPIGLAVAIASLLDRVRKCRGRQQLSGRDRVQENTVMILARARKAELIAAGMSKGKATDQAAEEAAAALSKTRGLSVTTIKRRMQRRR
jgi:hypothetical protein